MLTRAMTVQVEHGAYQGELVPVKTRASRRRVDLSSTAARVLRRQLLARKPNELSLVFPSPEGRVLNDDNFRHRVFRPAVRRTKLDGLRFHDLRHTYAALMVAAGAHPKYLQAQMATRRSASRSTCTATCFRTQTGASSTASTRSRPHPDPIARMRRRPCRKGKSLLPGTSKTGATGLEPATSGVTGRRSNQLNYAPERRRSV
jgi:hypothetical protein